MKTFAAITTDSSPIVKYFNGVKPAGSTNFLADRSKLALAGLVNGLVTFFGGALMCSDLTIPPYGGPALQPVHKRMMINVNEFNYFNDQVLTVLRLSGVAPRDLTAVLRILNSTKTDIVTV